jgi:hypothetical protein
MSASSTGDERAGVLTPEQDESPNGRDERKRHQDYSQRRQRHTNSAQLLNTKGLAPVRQQLDVTTITAARCRMGFRVRHCIATLA